VPAYVVFNDRTLDEIARRLPRTSSELASVPGMGPLRMRGYGDEILAVVNRFADALS
jgi:superfamily II DNA helicase RecQ